MASASTGGLRIIDHLAPLRPGRLEGRNGIGKSALVRLLTLISGEQPYLGDVGAWRSLKASVGPSVVTVDGLIGEFSHARVELTPDEWPDHPDSRIGEWLGTVELDGHPAAASEMFDAFHVVHLTGTEKLQDTLRHRTGRLAAASAEISRRLDGLEEQQATLGELSEELDRCSPHRAARDRAQVEDAARHRRDVADQLRTVMPKVADLQTAMTLRIVLDSGDAAKHSEELEQLRARLVELSSELADAEARHEAALARLDAGNDAQRQAAKLERKFRSLNKAHDQVLSRQADLTTRLEALGAAADAEALDPQQERLLAERRAQAASRQRQARLQTARQRRGTDENDVLDEVRVVLLDAIARGLGGLVLAHLHDRDVTVADLDAALGDVAVLPESDEEDLIAANAELTEWDDLAALFSQKAKLQAELDDVSTQLSGLGPQLAGQDALRNAASTARDAFEAITGERRTAQTQIGALTQSGLGGSDVVEAEARVADLLAEHRVAADDLAEALSTAQLELQTLRSTDQRLKQEMDELNVAAARRRVQRETLRRRAASEADVAWLAELASTSTHQHDALEEWGDETWQMLTDHVAAVRQAMLDLRRDVGGLQAVANDKDDRPSVGRHARAVNAVVEQDAVVQLSVRPIADALFDGGVVQRVSMEEQSITWTTPDGELRTRPLSVFSSGEQALGFVRAQLQEVADAPTQNRLIFLDEFGAFIAADRRRPLAELLTGEDLLGLSGQVVVILPLQADYEAELDQTTGQLHDTYERRVRDIAERGYFTEQFEQ